MPEDKPIELALLEDEAFERSLLAFGLEHIGGYSLVLRCGCDAAAQEAAARLEPPALAVVGYHPASPLGRAMLAWLHEHWQPTRVMALLNDLAVDAVQGAAQCGCHGFFCRATDDLDKLREGLHQLYINGSYVPPEVVRVLAQRPPAVAESELERVLNDTQLRILDAVCAPDEPTWDVVAERVFRSIGCIDGNRPTMCRLLGVKSKAGLVAMGRRNGFGQGRYS